MNLKPADNLPIAGTGNYTLKSRLKSTGGRKVYAGEVWGRNDCVSIMGKGIK